LAPPAICTQCRLGLGGAAGRERDVVRRDGVVCASAVRVGRVGRDRTGAGRAASSSAGSAATTAARSPSRDPIGADVAGAAKDGCVPEGTRVNPAVAF
jgi:hypothetical protein